MSKTERVQLLIDSLKKTKHFRALTSQLSPASVDLLIEQTAQYLIDTGWDQRGRE